MTSSVEQHDARQPALKNVRLEIASDLARADEEMLVLESMLREVGRGEDEAFRMALAFKEAVVNAIKYGNGSVIAVQLDIDAHHCTISVENESDTPLVIQDVPDPTSPEGLEKSSGRGLLFMQAYFDEVRSERYNRDGKQGNRVILTKTFAER